MTEPEFIKEAEDYIYKSTAKHLNQILGKNKTNHLSTGVFLKLPITVAATQIDYEQPKLTKELDSFMHYFSAYVVHGNRTEVCITFLYNKESDLQKILTNFKYRDIFFAFVYLHELQHIIRKHNTSSYNTMMTNIAKDIFEPHQLINIAEDHAINYSIKDLFMIAEDNIKKSWPEIEQISMYKSTYHEKQMSDIDILKDMLKNDNPITKQQISDMFEKITSNGKASIQPTKQQSISTEPADKTSTEQDDADTAMSDLSDALQGIMEQATRGTAAGELMNQLFDSIKVETGWFKKLKATFKRQVFYKTHDYTTSWSNLNNTFRRIYKSPKKNFIDNKIKLILSVDHSGSMHTEDLQRLLYLIESESTKISEILVLIHDTEIKKSFVLENEFDISKDPTFKDALSTRYAVGGTSHGAVFEYIENMKLKDPSEVFYMSFSDNESDIEQCFKQYPIMRRLTNYWICTQNNPVRVPGTNIQMF